MARARLHHIVSSGDRAAVMTLRRGTGQDQTFTTTGRPAPVPRTGTLPLTVPTACGPPSRSQGNFPAALLAASQKRTFLVHVGAA
jgi:hypothetical protein